MIAPTEFQSLNHAEENKDFKQCYKIADMLNLFTRSWQW